MWKFWHGVFYVFSDIVYYLSNEGHIYTTSDENHFKTTDT